MISAQEMIHALNKFPVQLLAGENGLSNIIRSIDVQEFPLKSTRIRESAMILTTFLGYTDLDSLIEQFEWYVHLGVSAIGVHNVALKTMPSQLIEIANEANIPLFTIPSSIPYHTIFNTYISLLNAEQTKEKETIDLLYETMINGLVIGKQTQYFLQLLGHFLKEWVIYYDENFIIQSFSYDGQIIQREKFLSFATNFPIQNKESFLEVKDNNWERYVSFDKTEQFNCRIYPLSVENHFLGYLVLSSTNELLDSLKLNIIKNAQTVLILEAVQKRQLEESYKNKDILLLEEVFYTNQHITMPFKQFYSPIEKLNQVIIYSISSKNTVLSIYKTIKEQLDQQNLGICWIRGNEIIVLCTASQSELLLKIPQVIDEVHIGVSDFLVEKTVNAYKQLYEQAKISLSIASKTNQTICIWEELGLQLFYHQLSTPGIQKYASEKLKKITDKELLHTLKIYIESNYSFKQSAENLHVHPNTVKYRIQKIELLLDEKINKNQVGLKWLFYINLLQYMD